MPTNRLLIAVLRLKKKISYPLVDCPGANTNYTRSAHAIPDLLSTPP